MKKLLYGAGVAIAAIGIWSGAASGQAPAGAPALTQQASFDAASVKVTDPKSAPANRAANDQATLRGGPGTADPGRISYANITLESILIAAYDANCKIQEDCDQVIGPAWLRSDRYDIDATMPVNTTAEQFRTMLQTLSLIHI